MRVNTHYGETMAQDDKLLGVVNAVGLERDDQEYRKFTLTVGIKIKTEKKISYAEGEKLMKRRNGEGEKLMKRRNGEAQKRSRVGNRFPDSPIHRFSAAYRPGIRTYIFIGLFLLLAQPAWTDTGAGQWIKVRWVDDGDTIVLSKGEIVRYIGINAPEIEHENQKAEP